MNFGLTVADAVLEAGVQAHIFCRGKGRKQRTTPLRNDVKQALRQWLDECPGIQGRPLFVSNRGGAFSRDGIERIVRKHANTALPKHAPQYLASGSRRIR